MSILLLTVIVPAVSSTMNEKRTGDTILGHCYCCFQRHVNTDGSAYTVAVLCF